MQQWHALSFENFHDAKIQALEVDKFIAGLWTSVPDVHTRILLMHHDFNESNFGVIERARHCKEELFIDHILGIEYDLSLAEIG